MCGFNLMVWPVPEREVFIFILVSDPERGDNDKERLLALRGAPIECVLLGPSILIVIGPTA